MPAFTPNVPPVIGVGASAGGVEAMRELFSALPPRFDAAVLVVLHLPPTSASRLGAVLGTVCALPISVARDGERIRPGHVYVAAPDRHLLLEGEQLRLTRGPRECRMRPAIDALFRSLSLACGPRAAGVVLSGMLDDGTAGLWAIKERGGAAFVQDPRDAMYASMPESALEHVDVDQVAPAAGLAPALVAWSARAAEARAQRPEPEPSPHGAETRIAAEGGGLRSGVLQLGPQSRYSCPACHGALLEIQEGRVVRFRCHTGHAFSIQTLLAEVDEAIDGGLWETIRAMEERLLLLRQIAGAADITGETVKAARYRHLAGEIEKPLERLRELVQDDCLLGHESA